MRPVIEIHSHLQTIATKKMKLSSTTATTITSAKGYHIEHPYPFELPAKPSTYHLVEKALDVIAEEIMTDPKFQSDINQLCTQITSLVQEMSGDKIAFTFKDMRNDKDLHFLRNQQHNPTKPLTHIIMVNGSMYIVCGERWHWRWKAYIPLGMQVIRTYVCVCWRSSLGVSK